MAGEVSTSTIDLAWGRISRTNDGRSAGTGSFTRTRVERIISVVAGLGSLALGTQAVVVAIGAEPDLWRDPLLLAVLGTLTLMVVACLVGRGVRAAAGAFAIVYLIALVLWPFEIGGSAPVSTQPPWIWYLVNIAGLAAVLAFPLPLQIAWAILAPVLFGLVRVIELGTFEPEVGIALALDVSFTLILGGVLITLGWLFRSVAAGVDDARARAVDSYARAAAVDAAEQERIAVSALMHDSVLAALIAAERAETPRERTLCVAMAKDALHRLAATEQDADEEGGTPTDAAAIAAEIERAAREMGVVLRVTRHSDPGAAEIPVHVGRALTLAATQALANAVQHAGAIGLAVEVDGLRGGVRIAVRDGGEGFDLDAVPADRLGIRASIVARVEAVGGTARVTSGPGGTDVRLSWHRVGES
ncbi:sensor histidine kinase [Microbacterium hominis]|uniref:ATP-binding protein n=1 Tax=Microbacterium hominis TaxID=162426 RepID=A0A7D4UBW1_9MICO|nr:ATP-binding protein [Microbacterium hominis]QKJ20043.1 ATP-binding protein [Microbacterium hominis]